MTTVWKDKFINPNKYSRPQIKITDVKKIVIHWTANLGATAENHYNYFNGLKDRYASAHFFVDKDEALCIIPLDEIAYHANDGTYRGVDELKPNANFLSLGIEMCVEKNGSFHENTIAGAILVAVELCKRYKLDPLKDIVRHYDITHKDCPSPWVKNSAPFEAFKKAVNNKVKEVKTVVKNPSKPTAKPVEKKSSKPKDVKRETVKIGSKGSIVKELQSLLVNKFGYKLFIDGDFGDNTLKAVRDFQKRNKLVADGVVGDNTWAKLAK